MRKERTLFLKLLSEFEMSLQKATDTNGSKYMLRYFDVNFIFKNKLLTKIYSASGRQIIPCVTKVISLLFIITVYYNCSQSTILDDFKDTNRKRIKRYECKGQLIVRINITSAHACVHMRHTSYHKRPDISIGVSVKL